MSSKSVTGICESCGQERQLIKAHIYPEWAYRALYPDGRVNNDAPLLLVSGSESRTRRSRIGIYDDQILCQSCDELIGRLYDGPAKRYLLETPLQVFKEMPEGSVYVLPGADPQVLKNFFLSLVWRASISQREEYGHVDSANPHQNMLKRIVVNNLATAQDSFGVFITRFRSKTIKDASLKYSQVPYPTELNESLYWILNLPNGYKAFASPLNNSNLGDLLPFALKQGSPVFVLEWEDFETSNEVEMLTKHLKRMRDQKRLG